MPGACGESMKATVEGLLVAAEPLEQDDIGSMEP